MSLLRNFSTTWPAHQITGYDHTAARRSATIYRAEEDVTFGFRTIRL